jgi:hypothetical protein
MPEIGQVSECKHCGERIVYRATEDRGPHWRHAVASNWPDSRGLVDYYVACKLSAEPA